MKAHLPADKANSLAIKVKGFTLIELLVAIAITAILGVGAAIVLNSGVRTKAVIEQRADYLNEIQKSLGIIESDLSQVINRSVRNEFGDRLYAFSDLNVLTLLEFSRTGWRDPRTMLSNLNPNAEVRPSSRLQRVTYELEDDVLYRSFWRVMDRAQDSEPWRQQLLTGIENIELRYLSDNNEWSDQWPSLELLSNEDVDEFQVLPKAVELVINHEVFGELTKLHLLAGWNTHVIRQMEAKEQSNRRRNGGSLIPDNSESGSANNSSGDQLGNTNQGGNNDGDGGDER